MRADVNGQLLETLPFIPLKEREALLEQKRRTKRHRIEYLRYPNAVTGILVAVACSIAAFVMLGMTSADGTPVYVPSAFLAFVAIMAGVWPWFLHRTSGVVAERQILEQQVRLERAQRVALALQAAKGYRATIRELRVYLQWTEEATVDGLRAAIERGFIFEDYDGELMQYFYISSAPYLREDNAHQAFDARLNAPPPADKQAFESPPPASTTYAPRTDVSRTTKGRYVHPTARDTSDVVAQAKEEDKYPF